MRSPITFAILFAVTACADATPSRHEAAVGNVVKSQLRGYDLGPPFPAGLRDSGLVDGYAEGEWVPFVAVIEGRKLAKADANEGSTGDGRYRLGIIVPTYSARHGANGISELAVTGTYGQGALTPIPDPFDDRWLVEHGYAPVVLGVYADGGAVDLQPEILGAAQRTGPTRFGGDVSSVSVGVRFAVPGDPSNVEVRFAVRLAPPGLAPITPDDQEFPGLAAGAAKGAADFFPGPGPIFVGYEVGDPTGIATVPIRVERHRCEDDDDCIAGDVCAPGGDCVTPCIADAACPTGDLCEDGVCVEPPPPCTSDEDCPTDDVCVGGFCVPECPETCNDPELCDPDPCMPPDGDEPPCVTDSDCPGKKLCEDGVCVPPTPPCDVSCPDEFECREGLCVPPIVPCTGDFDCPGATDCEEGVCVPIFPPCLPGDCPPCTFDADCPGGSTCEEGVCVPLSPPEPCVSNSDCPAPQTCEAGWCTPPPEPCGPSGECPVGELCEDGGDSRWCVPVHPPVPCLTPADCPPGDVCVGGWCHPDDGDAGTPCNNNNQCDAPNTCVGGVCTPPPPTEHPPIPCVVLSDCPASDLCVSGWCEPPAGCVDDDDCPGGELCEDGTCTPGQPPTPCTTNSDCPPGDDDVYPPVCHGGFCQPSSGSCFDDWGCPGGTVCENGACIDGDPIPCVSRYECGGHATCEGGFCHPTDPVEGCVTADDCPPAAGDDVGAACINGVCTTSMIHPQACTISDQCAPGTTCVAGACERIEGACELDDDCGGSALGGDCVRGWCGQRCGGDADCAAGSVCTRGRCGASCATYRDCGVHEACLGGGCVPLESTVSGPGGDPSRWVVQIPLDPSSRVSGGCAAAPGRSAGWPVAFVLLALAALLPAAVRRRWSALVPVLLALALGVAATACGDDDGDGDGDGGGGAADAALPDAAPTVQDDAGPSADGGGPSSPYLLLTCDPDEGQPDAAVAGADGGPPPGLDAPCCDPKGTCGPGLHCIQGPDPSQHRCRPACDLASPMCGEGGACANFGGQGVCIPASTEGQPCAPELCDAATICVGTSADDAVCRRRCTSTDDCDAGQTCTTLQGTSAMACL